MARKMDSKTFAAQKRKRRKMLTFMRMTRYGINSFTRNAWLSVAATAVMTVTLFFIFATVAAHGILSSTLNTLRDKVDISVYLKTDTPDSEATQIASGIKGLSTVKEVNYVSAEQARDNFISQNKDSAEIINATALATNEFPATLNVKVKDINNTKQLQDYVNHNATIQKDIDPNRQPTFSGPQSQSINTIGRALTLAQRIGVVASVIFATISVLIIFNTIRMAIFNRREEIQMMKLIGAEKSFIRGPFLVEAIVYGFIAAILASILAYGILYLISKPLTNYGVQVKPTLDFVTVYAGPVLLGMIIAGAIIGIVSSSLATRSYLKL